MSGHSKWSTIKRKKGAADAKRGAIFTRISKDITLAARESGGYGPGGTAIMMEVMTDNKNRTVPDIRHIMSKTGGNLGEQGCVNWMFEKKGTITILKEDINEDVILEKSLDLGAEDFQSENDAFIITTNPNEFGAVSKGLESEGYDISGEIGLSPINSVKVGGSDVKQLIDLIEKLEEHEDIQKVYSNFDFDESEITSLL